MLSRRASTLSQHGLSDSQGVTAAGDLKDVNVNLPANANSSLQQEILDSLPVLVFLEREGLIVFANAEARQVLGADGENWHSKPVEDVLWGLLPGTAEPRTRLAGSATCSPFHATMSTPGGQLVHVEGTYSLVSADLREAVIVAQTGVKESAPRPRLLEDVLASLPEAVVIVHGAHVLYTNNAFTHMFGYTAEEVSGGNLRDLIVPDTRHHENAMLHKALEEHGRAAIETVRMTKKGELVDVAMQMGPLLVGGLNAGHVLTYRDIGERKLVEAKLQYDAMHDVLTGLPNRALFEDRVNLALTRRNRRRDQGCGVLVIELDNFNEIHNVLGHAGGDMLLAALAQRLTSLLRPQDTFARIGTSDFALLVESVLNVKDLELVAGRILKDLEKPFEVLGRPWIVMANIGAAMAVYETANAESLIRDADFATYRARQSAERNYEVFDRQMGLPLDDLQDRERQLRFALSNRRFELLYEPVYRLANGRLECFESLLRMRRPDGVIDSVTDLLPVAEDTGLSISIGREVLDAVCGELRGWKQALPGHALMLAVNLTQRQFYHCDLVPQLKRTLAASKVDPAHLMFEISEVAVDENPDNALAILQRMADCGVRLALDNFGSGSASFNHLIRLPFNAVKMDPMLTRATTKGGREFAVLESLIHLCKSVGIQIGAQSIDTLEQLSTLRLLGCELGQGKLLAEALEPMHALEIAIEHLHSVPTAT